MAKNDKFVEIYKLSHNTFLKIDTFLFPVSYMHLFFSITKVLCQKYQKY